MAGRTVRTLQPMIAVPMMPNCLIRDEQPLPERYAPPIWAIDLVAEWGKSEDLKAVGAYPTQSALAAGPSGVGKTTAARWIGAQLKLPVMSMLLASAIESFMGATGSNVAKALQYAASTPCILLLDELDCLAANRAAKLNDVGEIWRITNTFIQSLDRWHAAPTSSFLMATTNMPESIDPAIRRRFEVEVLFELPTSRELSHLAGVALPASVSMSHAAMRRYVLRARRRAVMTNANYELILMSLIAEMS